MTRDCVDWTTPAGNTARLQLLKPADQLTGEEREYLDGMVDAATTLLANLPDTSCTSCGALGRFPECYPAKRRRALCCDVCDHTERAKP